MSAHPPRPSIDHTILSPSGRASRRARKAILDREAARLFPPGFWDGFEPQPSTAEAARARAAMLRSSAQRLQDLAERGMSPKKFRREAASLEAEAKLLDGEVRP